MTFTYFGHATFQIETNGTTFLFDPFLADNNPHTDVTPDELDPDVIPVSHAHADHFLDVEPLTDQGTPLVISNFEIITHVGETFDHEHVHPLNEGGLLRFDWGSIEAVHARHTSSFPDGSYGGVPVGFVLDFGDKTVYYTGDTAPFAEMQWIGDDYDVDVMVAPVGGVVTMGVEGAIRAAKMVQPTTIIPVHYDTFPFIEVDLDAVADAISEAGFTPHPMDFDTSTEF